MVEDIIDDDQAKISPEQTYTSAPKRKRSIFERLAYSSTAIGIVLVVALIFMWFGVMFFMASLPPNSYYSIGLLSLGSGLYSIGTSLLIILLLGLGIGRYDYPQWVRFALILVAGMIIVWGFHLGGAFVSSIIHYSPP